MTPDYHSEEYIHGNPSPDPTLHIIAAIVLMMWMFLMIGAAQQYGEKYPAPGAMTRHECVKYLTVTRRQYMAYICEVNDHE